MAHLYWTWLWSILSLCAISGQMFTVESRAAATLLTATSTGNEHKLPVIKYQATNQDINSSTAETQLAHNVVHNDSRRLGNDHNATAAAAPPPTPPTEDAVHAARKPNRTLRTENGVENHAAGVGANADATTKNWGYDLFNKLRPVEIFRPIAAKFSDVVNSFYPAQPYINNEYFGYGSDSYTPAPLTVPGFLLEKLNQKAQHLFTNAHGAIFGTGFLGHADYPFAVRAVNFTHNSAA